MAGPCFPVGVDLISQGQGARQRFRSANRLSERSAALPIYSRQVAALLVTLLVRSTMPSSATAADVGQLITDAQVPGLSMAVIRNGGIETLTAAGVRNARDGAPIDQQTIFDAASLSKPVFAYAVLQLIDAGALTLDTPLARHAPDYVPDDPRAGAITVRHVLSHSSGLPNWRSIDLPLKTYFPPGERFSYSGEGFVWLQRVVEAITGDPIGVLLYRLVFEPLAMRQSSFVWQSAFDANYADPHDATLASDLKKKPATANTAASLQTTARDYACFLRGVLSGARLKPETARLWLSPQVTLRRRCVQCLASDMPESDTQVAWGLGWGLEPQSGAFFQWGDNDRGRFKAFAMGSLQGRSAVVVFTNGFNGMSIMPELVDGTLPGAHPAFDWLNYPRFRKG
jgi:CubicO group peptidase (beta-lactamase class C family)